MKILHVLDHSIPLHSGYTFRTLSILRQQRSLGWHTEHLTSGKQGRAGVQYHAVEHVDGFSFYRTPPVSHWWHKLPAAEPLSIIKGLTARLHEVVEDVQPDILHAHSPALNGIAALRVAKVRNLPVLYECRAFWEDAAVNHGTCSDRSLRYHLTRALESYVFRKVDGITTICEGLRQDIIARGEDPEKITVIPNAVDIEHFQQQGDKSFDLLTQLNLTDKTIMGFFGSFYDYEGLMLLLDAMPDIVRRDSSIRLLLVGGGPQEELLKSRIQSANLSQYVIMVGRVPHDTIQEYYQLADIMVYPRLPMRLTDLVTPLKPLEAMAQNKIVVASDVGGHKELIRDGENGFLFEAGNAHALADKVLNVLQARHTWPQLQSQGRSYVVNDRNWQRSVSYYKDAYGRACEV